MGIECNFAEAIERLESLNKRVGKELIDEALESGSEEILQGQLLTVPVGDTGKLKRSLGKGKKTGTGANRKVDIGIINAQANEVVYGYYQEHGTERMNGKKWMKRAWNKNKDKAQEKIKETIVEGLTKI